MAGPGSMDLNIQTRGMPHERGRECNLDNERGACTASSEACVEILNSGRRATIAKVRNISQQPEGLRRTTDARVSVRLQPFFVPADSSLREVLIVPGKKKPHLFRWGFF